MIKRRKSKELFIGNVKIGNNAPISVQSMCNTDTRDVNKTLNQINELADKGCELVRLAVLNVDAADAIKDIVNLSEYKDFGARKIDKIISSKIESVIIDKIINNENYIRINKLKIENYN